MSLRAAMSLASILCVGLCSPVAAAGATASWRFEPPSFDFGTRLPADGPTGAKAFELQNTGEAPLTPSLASISSQGGSGFELVENGCDHQLAPGAGCTIEVAFDPGSKGRKEGTLTVESSGPAVPAATAQLVGSGGEPVVAIDQSLVVFDPVTIPTGSLPGVSERAVTVANVGSAELSITGLGYAEEGAAASSPPSFALPGKAIGPGLCLRATVPPGGSCAIDLDFSPRAPGTYRAEIDLEDDAPGPPAVISLYGTAVAQAITPPPPPSAPPVAQKASPSKFTHGPPRRTRSRTATFIFSAASSPGGFECRGNGTRRFRPCASPTRLRRLRPGAHAFWVRALGSDGAPGPARAYHWRIVD